MHLQRSRSTHACIAYRPCFEIFVMYVYIFQTYCTFNKCPCPALERWIEVNQFIQQIYPSASNYTRSLKPAADVHHGKTNRRLAWQSKTQAYFDYSRAADVCSQRRCRRCGGVDRETSAPRAFLSAHSHASLMSRCEWCLRHDCTFKCMRNVCAHNSCAASAAVALMHSYHRRRRRVRSSRAP